MHIKTDRHLIMLLSLVLIFITIGFIFIYSSSSVYALEKLGSSHYYIKKQLIGCILGFMGIISIRYLPLGLIKAMAPWGFFASLALVALSLIPRFGSSIHGSSRWIYLAGVSFQPSELLKITFILYMSYLLAKKEHCIQSLTRGFIPLLLIIALCAALLLKQPDFGQTVTLTITAFMLFYLAQCNIKHILVTLSMLIPVGGALILFKPYRFRRILTFLNPWSDPQNSGFQIIQSLIAIGSGHITGVGVAQSKQKYFYLPMQHTDFIFSIIAEETGFIGATILVMLFVLFLYAGIKISQKLTDPFCIYATLGFVILTTLQALINFFVSTGMLPTKGLGLPFISYGNSAIMCNLLFIGLIINFMRSQSRISANQGFILDPLSL